MFGWTGNTLRINLSNGAVIRESTDPKLARIYIGGRGLGSKIMFDEVAPCVDPLSPETN